MSGDPAWASLHVHYHGDLEALLVEGVGPAVAELEDEGGARLWHHVRYWNGGPHVRVRVLPAAGEPDAVAARLERRIADWLARHPGGPADAAAYEPVTASVAQVERRLVEEYPFAAAFLEPIEPFVDRDAVLRRPYVFDTARYGEGPLRDVAERNFSTSSGLALTLAHACRGRPGAARAWCLRLMACLPAALQLRADAATELFRRYHASLREVMAPAGGEDYRPFEELRPLVLEAIDAARGRGVAGAAAAVIERWRGAMASSAGEIEAARREREAPQDTTDLLIDYLHMMNNRMGVAMAEEAQLTDLLQRGYAWQR